MGNSYQIGVDGGGTKTELILVDESGQVVAQHLAPGCNPSITGPERANELLLTAMNTLLAQAKIDLASSTLARTLLCMAGNRAFWQETTAALSTGKGFGQVIGVDDSLPVLELATDGKPGLVLHSGTGSFVAARATNGRVHYAGGLGWRFGDPGSGYDLGRRGITYALLELQGWRPASRLSAELCNHTGLSEVTSLTRFFYHETSPNARIASFAPFVLRLAADGDATAHQLIAESTGELLALAHEVAKRLFPDIPLTELRTGLSGPFLTHRIVLELLKPRSTLPLVPVTATPIEGVRRLLARHFIPS